MGTSKHSKITIVGAGPVGTLLSIYFAKQGHQVDVFEKRNDPRLNSKAEGRSINIALSHRGLRALKEANVDEEVKSIAIPMKGRMIHTESGELNFQPYGKEGQVIYSVSRNELNRILIDNAEKKHKVKFEFGAQCVHLNANDSTIEFQKKEEGFSVKSDVVIGSDGAFSAVRKSFSTFPDFISTEENLSHGYIELHMPAAETGVHQMEKNALHIWPRGKHMLIALPNLDGSFTCTLFLPMVGENSFESIGSVEQCKFFFENNFPDVLSLIDYAVESYFAHKPSFLTTVQCFPWYYENTLLIGDAAHAITPFYGQGMNAGFEDCRILNEISTRSTSWKDIFKEFQLARKENTDAIAKLALDNFVEMKELVADENFLLRKKIEAVIHSKLPAYLPLYTMVTFSDLSYKDALNLGKSHDLMMKEVMQIPDIHKIYTTEEGWQKIRKVIDK